MPLRVQLKSPEGGLLRPEQELDLLKSYSTEVFARGTPLSRSFAAEPVHFPLAQVRAHLNTIPIGKAVPLGSSPVSAWRSAPDEFLTHATSLLEQEASSTSLTPYLKNPFVTWIPKPNKPPSHPRNLRPIGVISPPGKILAGLVREELLPYVLQYASSLPQYAYLPGCGVEDAINRACHHLDEALARQQFNRSDKHKQQLKVSGLQGSLTLSVDLSKAFDLVDRSCLLKALHKIGVPPSIIRKVELLHLDTAYQMSISQLTASVSTTNGIKQGCKLAPLLWTALTLLLCKSLEDVWGSSVIVDQVLTLFADDILHQEHFRTWDELEAVLARVTCLFQVLRDLGLEVNPSKSSIMLSLQGTQSQQARDFLYVKLKNQLYLTLPDGSMVPVQRQIT